MRASPASRRASSVGSSGCGGMAAAGLPTVCGHGASVQRGPTGWTLTGRGVLSRGRVPSSRSTSPSSPACAASVLRLRLDEKWSSSARGRSWHEPRSGMLRRSRSVRARCHPAGSRPNAVFLTDTVSYLKRGDRQRAIGRVPSTPSLFTADERECFGTRLEACPFRAERFSRSGPSRCSRPPEQPGRS